MLQLPSGTHALDSSIKLDNTLLDHEHENIKCLRVKTTMAEEKHMTRM
jgi:hypothetical protein